MNFAVAFQTVDLVQSGIKSDGSCDNISDAQLHSTLDAFQTIIAMNSSSNTGKYIQERLGDCETVNRYRSTKGNITEIYEHRPAAELYELVELQTGEAFIKLLSKRPFKFRFDRYF